MHPFVEAAADQLPERLGPAARWLLLRGLQNDWIHQGLAIVVEGEERATVSLRLDGSKELRHRVRLRVIGFIKQKGLGYSLDPVFDRPKDISLDHKAYMRNFENIYDFPTVTAMPEDPVAIWITADTRGMAAGRYRGSVVVTGEDGKTVRIPLILWVRAYELPLENPLVTCGWQYTPDGPEKSNWMRLFHDYGVNATHVLHDWEAAREAGYKFFFVMFKPSWYGKAPEEVPSEETDRAIAEIKAKVAQLKLQPHEWALYLLDEPHDEHVPKLVEWCKLIRRKWPEARFLFNPGYGPGPELVNEWATIEGTVEPLMPFADVWLAYSAWLYDDRAPRSIPLMKQSADCVWNTEIMGFSYTRSPSVGRGMMRTLPYMAWKYRLQGCGWYALNAYVENPWADCTKQEEYGCAYYTVPGRGLEALREGIGEYKRLHELRRLGVPDATLDAFAERVFAAKRITDIDRVRREMDDMLCEREPEEAEVATSCSPAAPRSRLAEGSGV